MFSSAKIRLAFNKFVKELLKISYYIQNVRRYAPRKGSMLVGQAPGGHARAQGRPPNLRHRKTNFCPGITVFLGLRGDGTLFGYTVLDQSIRVILILK